MPTTPVASPSSPSTKFTAFEHSTMKNTVIATEVVLSSETIWLGSGIHSILTPSATAMPAANTCPANLVSGGSSKTSSSTPTRQITVAATSTAQESCCTVASRPRNGSCHEIKNAAATPANIATPPKYGSSI